MQHLVEWVKEWGFAWGILIAVIIATVWYLIPDFIKPGKGE